MPHPPHFLVLSTERVAKVLNISQGHCRSVQTLWKASLRGIMRLPSPQLVPYYPPEQNLIRNRWAISKRWKAASGHNLLQALRVRRPLLQAILTTSATTTISRAVPMMACSQNIFWLSLGWVNPHLPQCTAKTLDDMRDDVCAASHVQQSTETPQ